MTVTRDWLYLRIHPAHPDDLDSLVRDLVGGLRGPLSEEVSRWFWLRYLDRGGAHLRLRALTTPRSAERILAATEALAPHGAPVRPGFYQREYEVFGGRAGVELAEERFQVSSELVLELLADPLDEDGRLRWARGLLAAAVTRTLPAPDQVRHLRNTAAYWANAGHLPIDGSRRWDRAELQEGVAAVLALGWGERWLAGLSRPDAMADTPLAPTPDHWLFRLVHLTLNRLGVPPAVEGALAAELADLLAGAP